MAVLTINNAACGEIITTTTTQLPAPVVTNALRASGETCQSYNCCDDANFPYSSSTPFFVINTALNLHFGNGVYTYSDLEYLEITYIEAHANFSLKYNSIPVSVGDKIYNNGLSSFQYGYLYSVFEERTCNTSEYYTIKYKFKFYGLSISEEVTFRSYLNFSTCAECETTTTTTYVD